MRAFLAVSLLAFWLGAAWASPATTPERGHGISMHMIPKRVADLMGDKWGFVVSYAPYLKPETAEPVIQSAPEFIAFVRRQDTKVQANGVWIVTTHPTSYSPAETTLLEDLKALCRKQKIPLFIARGSELPDGWKRYDVPP